MVDDKLIVDRLKVFVGKWKVFDGKEISEAQTFINDLFWAFNLDRTSVGAKFEEHPNSLDASGSERIDLLWEGKLIIEMKKPAEKDLSKYRKQAVNYWVNLNPKPDYIILCNFKELWIYEPKEDSDLPRVKIKLNDLPRKYGYLKFFIGEKPVFDEENIELKIINKLGECAVRENTTLPLNLDNFPIKNLYGIEKTSFGAMLTQIVLWINYELIREEYNLSDIPLPLEDLKNNIICGDALDIDWNNFKPSVIIGNPPYLGGKKIREELGDNYTDWLYDKFKDSKGQPDFVTYWFRKAVDTLKDNQRCGFVATNSVRQNQSRENSLDLVVNADGIIFSAVSTQKWSGEAKVHVSIVNWIKNPDVKLEKILDGKIVDNITSYLTNTYLDLRNIKILNENKNLCFQGIEPRADGFLLTNEERLDIIKKDKTLEALIKPYLIGKELNNQSELNIKRYVIYFANIPLEEAQKYKILYDRVYKLVKPIREVNRNKKRREKWWQLGTVNEIMIEKINKLSRYIGVSYVSKHVIFRFIPSDILPSNAINAIAFDDYFHFGILQSKIHRVWVLNNCSTFETRIRYTVDTVFETFPFPQDVSEKIKGKISVISEELYRKRAGNIISG